MIIRAIDGAMAGQKSAILRKVARRVATLALGTGLLITTAGSAKAQNTDDVVRDTVETTQNSDKSTTGGLIFGGTILAYMGLVALGNKIHDKNNSKN